MKATYPVIEFHQYDGSTSEDRMLLFAAKAKDIAAWAGIPRKGWRIRMLFQRWITPGREEDLKEFWTRASKTSLPPAPNYVLGPTAVVIAVQGEPEVKDGRITLEYRSPIDGIDDPVEKLSCLAKIVFDKVRKRLSPEDAALLDEFSSDPLKEDLPDPQHNYVLEFAFQLAQMRADAAWFANANAISAEELRDLITAMEALCRPAIVVDGQHRLWGAAATPADISLPVVAITHSQWTDQIYQFVVINEKAQKVDSELLSDIFASSLTPTEQDTMRADFGRVKVDIEQRIAGVLAGRKPESPFYQMVTLNLPNPPASEASAYISQIIIQSLIDGGRGARGWRSDSAFYESYVKPTFPIRDEWENWREGKWRDYWFAFWMAVKDSFTPQAKRIRGTDFEIWSKSTQSNLTKGVGLKVFQRFFMERMIEDIAQKRATYSVLVDVMGEEAAAEKIEEQIQKASIPGDVDEFYTRVKGEFLDKFPVRFFTTPWVASLDDDEGRDRLIYEMREAFTRDRWRAQAKGLFDTASGE
jgi:hypothetical protein